MKIQLSDHFTYRKLFRFVLPSIVMMVFTSIYGVIDGLFVSNFVGKNAFAAVNLIMPFIMILGSVGFMIGTGGTALVSMTMGTGDGEKANKYFSMLVAFTIVCGIVLSTLGVIFTPQVARVFGAKEDMLNNCIIYGRIVIAFNTAYMLQNVFQSFFVTAEKPKLGLIITVISGITNMVLDALFIAIFDMGVIGAALATGISQCVGGIIPVIYFINKNTSRLRLSFRTVRFELSPIVKACTNGSSELMSNIATSVVSILYNYQLIRFAGADGVSVYGVLMYVQFIFVAVFVGYAVGSAPIVGYHYGADNYDELHNMKNKSIKVMIVAGIVMMGLAQLLAEPLAKIFVGYDKGLYDMTIHAFRIFAASFMLTGFNIFASSFFTALGNGAISATISFLRTLVFQMLMVILLPIIFDIDGIWYSLAVAEICASIISVTFLIGKKKKYNY